MNRVMIVAAVVSLTNPLFGQVDVCVEYPAGIVGPEEGDPLPVWTAAESPYIVNCDLHVAGLVIEPGVTVQVNGEGNGIHVNGVLKAVGTAEEPILFTSPAGDWSGIEFDSTAPGSELKHCIIEKSQDSGLTLIDTVQVIEDCTFRDNHRASGNGGGVHVTSGVDGLRFVRCSFLGNTARRHGGGIAVQGEAEVFFRKCAFLGNVANPTTANGNYQGGGAHLDGGVYRLVNCALEANRCNARSFGATDREYSLGGGVYVSGIIEIGNSLFRDNVSSATDGGCCRRTFGGGIYAVTSEVHISNTIVEGNSNTAGHQGAGLWLSGSQSRIVNSTIIENNREGIHVEGGALQLCNSILFWNNGDGQQLSRSSGGAVTVKYSCIQHGWEGEGEENIAFNPGFASSSIPRIVPGSPCIDAGDPDPAFDDVCLPPSLGTPRNDIGAHGGPGACDWDLPGDCNGNLTDDGEEIASGREADCDADGVPDSCQIAENPDLDGDDDGLLDTCAGRSVRLVRTGDPGLCFDVVVTSDVPFGALELALGIDPDVLRITELTDGPDLPALATTRQSPADPTSEPLLLCEESGRAGVILGWVLPGGAEPVLAGEHTFYRTCVEVVDTAPVTPATLIDFPFCLGAHSEFPITNIITDEAFRSLPLHDRVMSVPIANFRRGDVNADGLFDVSDAVQILACEFLGTFCPGCPDAADVNDDGEVDMIDAIHHLNWRFLGGLPPDAPFPGCGRDVGVDDLAPCSYPACF